ncbi:MAG: radical SAM family heme chaperone HemW [bacterium]|nr:radical SAM family heme chaperone HemW [bacterium]
MATPGFGVYVHWPFCQSKCPYCDFNSHVRAAIDEASWCRALTREIAFMASLTRAHEVTSIFFGGGTPSLMGPATVEAVLCAIAGHWTAGADVEVTLEANPGSSDASRFACYRSAGINRISIGVQALDDSALRALGRRHDVADARAAISAGRRIFDRLSFDLIYGRSGQTIPAWRDELAGALTLGADHLSLYQLTIEPGTRFATLAACGDLILPPADARADMRDVTQDLTLEAGLPAYEISNHARPGEESRHNLVYWRSGEWVGVGPGACGRLDSAPGVSIERRQERRPETWLSRVHNDGHATCDEETVKGLERLREVLMMGLRLTAGLDGDDLARAAGPDWSDHLDASALRTLVDAGFLRRCNGGLAATPRGHNVLNAVLERLL